MTTKTRKLTESAMLMAVAAVLEIVSKMFIPNLPLGGQVTICSMLPIVLISYRHGVKWGVLCGFAYSFLQMALGAKNVAAAFQPGYFGDETMLFNAFLMCALDYVLAFTCLGLGGIFRNRIQNRGLALALGGLVALFGRYICHVLSGYILFSEYAAGFFTDSFPTWGATLVSNLSPNLLGLLYSVVYNGMYMSLEMIITVVGALLLAKIPSVVRKQTA